MKDTITRRCGHKEVVIMTGGDYDRQRKYQASRLCRDCYRAEQRRIAEEEAAKAMASDDTREWAEIVADLPTLTGSDKQVAWASDIRRSILTGLVKDVTDHYRRMAEAVEAGDADPDQVEADKAHTRKAVGALARKAQAKYWIDRRRDRGVLLLKEIARREAE